MDDETFLAQTLTSRLHGLTQSEVPQEIRDAVLGEMRAAWEQIKGRHETLEAARREFLEIFRQGTRDGRSSSNADEQQS